MYTLFRLLGVTAEAGGVSSACSSRSDHLLCALFGFSWAHSVICVSWGSVFNLSFYFILLSRFVFEQPKKMTITVRDSKGQPVLPAVEYFGDENEHRTAAREATAQLEAEQVKTTSSDEPTDAVDRRTLPRTFLERSPPPECVQPVLPAGCTMRRLSVVAINLVVLVSFIVTIPL